MEAQAPAQQEQAPDETQIIDQIGALMQQLPPESQALVLEQLGKLLAGQQDVSSPEQGAAGVPVGM